MGATSELGPIDPQITWAENGELKRFSVFNVVKSYEGLFQRALEAKGNLEPYLQQLANYDERDITEMRAALALSEDIAIRCLASGMMAGKTQKQIKEKIKIFLTPERTKTHGRPIYKEEAATCGLNIEMREVRDPVWQRIYELYIRTNNFVDTKAAKSIESSNHAFTARFKG